MTRTAVGSADRRTTSLSLPSPPEVVRLQAVQDYPAVSVLCSTAPAPRMTAVDAARLDSLVEEAVSRLDDETENRRQLRGWLEELAEDARRRPTRAAVALYVSAKHASSWALPVPVLDRAVVDPTFATRDLVRSLHRTPRHVVLVLTDREARLFDGVADTLLPPPAGPFPLTTATTRPAGRQTSTRRPAADRGTAVEQTGDGFLRVVDRALGTYLSLHPAPLVLVGTQRTLTQFSRLSRNLGRLAGPVYGSHARTPLPVLVGLIRPVLERYLHGRQGEALELLDRRTSAGRVVTGMPSVWLAARTERPEMLAVEHSLFYPARLSADGHFLEPATDVEHPDVIDDAVDEVIELVLRRGGWVALVDDGALAGRERIALSVYTS